MRLNFKLEAASWTDWDSANVIDIGQLDSIEVIQLVEFVHCIDVLLNTSLSDYLQIDVVNGINSDWLDWMKHHHFEWSWQQDVRWRVQAWSPARPTRNDLEIRPHKQNNCEWRQSRRSFSATVLRMRTVTSRWWRRSRHAAVFLGLKLYSNSILICIVCCSCL